MGEVFILTLMTGGFWFTNFTLQFWSLLRSNVVKLYPELSDV